VFLSWLLWQILVQFINLLLPGCLFVGFNLNVSCLLGGLRKVCFVYLLVYCDKKFLAFIYFRLFLSRYGTFAVDLYILSWQLC